jgi:hypothetical protein
MVDGYFLKRRDMFLGKKLLHGETNANRFIRLAKRDAGIWKRPVHEVWELKGKTETLSTPLDHNSAETISDFVKRLDYYTTKNADYLYNQGVKSSFLSILSYPAGKFLANYVLKRGFLDGTHGFVHAMFMSFHSFLTRAKLYLLWHR